MNKDQVRGGTENLKGRVKEAAGVLTGNKSQEAEGAADRAKGAVQKTVGDVKHSVARKLEKDPPAEKDDPSEE
jgi:uncharacterized protein YjbJ (UPF0337 family)